MHEDANLTSTRSQLAPLSFYGDLLGADLIQTLFDSVDVAFLIFINGLLNPIFGLLNGLLLT